jgi:hypothetical protein
MECLNYLYRVSQYVTGEILPVKKAGFKKQEVLFCGDRGWVYLR